MALLATGSALVAGSCQETEMATRQIKVVRSFYVSGKPTKVGDVLDVSASFAQELISARKAEPVEPKAEAPKAETGKKGEK